MSSNFRIRNLTKIGLACASKEHLETILITRFWRLIKRSRFDGKFFFVFLNLHEYGPQETFAYIWNFQQFRINAKKFEKMRIHFNNYVFSALVGNAKTP